MFIGNGEISRLIPNVKTNKIELIMAYNTRVPPNTETIVTEQFNRLEGLGACSVEPIHLVIEKSFTWKY